MKSEIFLLHKKIEKMTKKITEKQKLRYSDKAMTKMTYL